jgi:hypothetical protein
VFARTRSGSKASPLWKNDWNLVFTSASGAPLHGPNVTLTFQRRLKAAGLPRQRYHDLQHGAASLLLAHDILALLSRFSGTAGWT